MDEEEMWALAGEYVLGLLEGAARARAEALRAQDARFAAAVGFWEGRLMPLLDEVAEVAPPERVWGRVAALVKPKRRVSARRQWLGVGLALGAMALLAFYVQPERGRPVGGFGTAYGVIEVEANAADIIVRPQGFVGPAGKSVEIWLIVGGGRPRAMGVVRPFARFSVRRPPAGEAVVIAASLEPEGGSPTGLPTGRVIGEVAVTGL